MIRLRFQFSTLPRSWKRFEQSGKVSGRILPSSLSTDARFTYYVPTWNCIWTRSLPLPHIPRARGRVSQPQKFSIRLVKWEKCAGLASHDMSLLQPLSTCYTPCVHPCIFSAAHTHCFGYLSRCFSRRLNLHGLSASPLLSSSAVPPIFILVFNPHPIGWNWDSLL